MLASTAIATSVSTRGPNLTTLFSWLRAVNIEPLSSNRASFAVRRKDGVLLDVLVTDITHEPPPDIDSDVLVLDSKALAASLRSSDAVLNGRKPLEVALSEFHVLTERAGFGRPLPFDRGAEPDKKLFFEDESWMCSFRHTELRRAPNPDPAKFEKYAPILKRQSYLFFVTNKYLCDYYTYSLEDCNTLAQVALINFCAHFERAVEGRDGENCKLLVEYLKQRFAELRKGWNIQIRKKGRAYSMPTHEDGSFILGRLQYSRYNSYEEDFADRMDFNGFMEELSDGEVEPYSFLDTLGDERRVDAKADLEEVLSNMDHNDMVDRLLTASYLTHLDDETRALSDKLLAKHCKTCELCKGQPKKRKKRRESTLGADLNNS